MSCFEIDYLSFVIGYDESYKIENEHSMYPQLRKIFEVIEIYPSENSYSKIQKNEYIYCSVVRGKLLQVQLTGSFFLLSSYRDKLSALFKLVFDEKWEFHVTRIDYCLDLIIDYENLYKIYSSSPQKLTEVSYRSKGEYNYYALFNSSYSFNSYNKQSLLVQKKQKKYAEAYYQKHPEFRNKESISRIEFRIKGEGPCTSFTKKIEKSEDVANATLEDFYLYAGKRFKVPAKIKKILEKYKKGVLYERNRS